MREDMTRAIAGLSGKLQRECRKRARVLDELSGYLRRDEVVELVCPAFWNNGALLITTQRLLYTGNGSENIPLTNIRGTAVPIGMEQMFPYAKSELVVYVHGGETSFSLCGTGAAREAEKTIRKALMR